MIFNAYNYYPEADPPRGEAYVFMTRDYFEGLDAACVGVLGKTMVEYAASDPRGFFDQFYTTTRAVLGTPRFIGHLRDVESGAEAALDSDTMGDAARVFDEGDAINPDTVQVDFEMQVLPPETPPADEMARLGPEDHWRLLRASQTVVAFTLNPPGAT
jgi:hypothetical protein